MKCTKIYGKCSVALSIMIFLGLQHSFAQAPIPYKPQVIPPSPQSQIFENYLNHEITEYSGLPKIEIPLYEIKLKDISIPITLSYHASGVKYMQYDGDIAAGWSIGASGYRLTRSLKGADDFGPVSLGIPQQNFQSVKTQQDFYGISDERKRDNFLYFLSYNPDKPEGGIPEGVSAGMVSGGPAYGDGQYDKFSYMLPTTSGSFIIKDRQNLKVALLDDKRDSIEIQRQQCKITDINGIEYYLGGIADGTELFEKQVATQHETTWVLRQIRTPNNETINFRYKRLMTANNRAKETLKGITITDAPYNTIQEVLHPQLMDVLPPDEGWSVFNHYNQGPLYGVMLFLDEIETDHILVRFERGSLLDMTQILKRIVITDKLSQKIINEIVLNNSVFPSAIDTYSAYKNTPSHILLNSVTSLNKTYNLDYFAPPSNYRTSYPDQWNNYNFSQSSRPVPNIYLHEQFRDEKLLAMDLYAYIPSGGATNQRISTMAITDMANTRERSADTTNLMSFSLKKIQYPTGGSTEYTYEAHETAQGKGGGLRIKKMVSRPDLSTTPIVTEYRYRNGQSSFILDHHAFSSESYSVNHTFVAANPDSFFRYWYAKVKRSVFYSMDPVGDFDLSDYNIYYRNVDVLQFDQASNKYNGKKSSEYNLPSFPQATYYDGAFLSLKGLAYPIEENYHRKKGILRTYDGRKPTLKSSSYYDELNQLVRKEIFNYKRVDSVLYHGIKVRQRISSGGGYVPPYPQYYDLSTVDGNDYSYFSSYFDWTPYEIETGTDILVSKTETQFTPSGEIVRAESFEHNDNNQVSKVTLADNTNGNGKIRVTEMKYPKDFASGNNVYQQLIDKNIISPVIETVESAGANQELRRSKTEYGTFGTLLLPLKTALTAQGVERTVTNFDMYDSKGNLLQYTPYGGNSVFYLWSYNYRYPVAEIRNVNVGELDYVLYNRFGTTLQGHSSSLVPIFDEALLRSDLPQALITTYAYEPSIGISSITDPRGRRTRYIYDSFNRLKYVEDHEGRLVNEYDYHYRTSY